MLKNLLRLFTAVISFLVLLVLPNTANAATQVNSTIVQAENLSSLQPVSLNVISPSLNLNNNQSQDFHLGCSCAMCIQENTENRI